MNRSQKFDIVISGAGVAGLWQAYKLSALGYSVAILEKARCLAGFASTRNEGWLHCGTYHGGAIPVREIAVRVARQTLNGYRQTLRFAPEAVEDVASQSFAFVRNLDPDEVESRWSEVGVPFARISDGEFAHHVPEVKIGGIAAIFRVQDKSINNRVLYEKLRDESMRHGVQFFIESEIVAFDGMRATVRTPTAVETFEAEIYLYSAGFGIKEFFLTRFDQEIDLHLRFWKSHLIDLPRVASHGVFYVDPGEATLMHHQQFTIAGFNSDSKAVSVPDFDPIPEQVELAKASLRRMLCNVDFKDARPRACVKVDQEPSTEVDMFVPKVGAPYPRPQLGVTMGQPLPGHFWVLPGKMTEAPFVADRVVEAVRNQIPAPRNLSWKNVETCQSAVPPKVADRPIDLLS